MIIEETGYTPNGHYYMIVVLENLGTRNGYVAVKPDSNLWGLNYSYKISIDGGEETYLECLCDVHGGLTYSGNLGMNIIGADNHFFFGFDCAHFEDGKIPIDELAELVNTKMRTLSYHEKQQIINRYIMLNTVMPSFGDEVYRSTDFVRAECYDLSEQLFNLESKEIELIPEADQELICMN